MWRKIKKCNRTCCFRYFCKPMSSEIVWDIMDSFILLEYQFSWVLKVMKAQLTVIMKVNKWSINHTRRKNMCLVNLRSKWRNHNSKNGFIFHNENWYKRKLTSESTGYDIWMWLFLSNTKSKIRKLTKIVYERSQSSQTFSDFSYVYVVMFDYTVSY